MIRTPTPPSRRAPILLLAAFILHGCASDPGGPSGLFLEVSAEAGTARVKDARALWFQFRDPLSGVRRPETPGGDPSFVFALAEGRDLGERAVTVQVSPGSLEGVVQFRIEARDAAGQVVAARAGLVDLGRQEVVEVVLRGAGSACDADGDGFEDCGREGCCRGFAALPDCDDGRAAVNPFAIEDPCEPCADTADNDCDGSDAILGCSDADADGIGDGCGDCAPQDPEVHPGAVERCDAKDNDCNGQTDEGFDLAVDLGPRLNLGAPCGVGACAGGVVVCAAGGEGATCNTWSQKVPEQCENAVDDDCDGLTDEGCDVDDWDGDGWVNAEDCPDHPLAAILPEVYPNAFEPCCPLDLQGAPDVKVVCDRNCDGEVVFCAADDTDHDGVPAGVDCDDADPSIHPALPDEGIDAPAERCGDGVDQDCVGGDLACAEGRDADGDRYLEGAGDCDDGDPKVHPGAAEVCNGRDDDCDGIADDGNPGTAGGWAGAEVALSAPCHPGGEEVAGRGECAPGLWTCLHGVTDLSGAPVAEVRCMGFRAPVNEECDGLDNDCDGSTDEGFKDTDADGQPDCVDDDDDGDGDPDALDCAPLDPLVNHGAGERCNGVDDDCDGSTDESFQEVGPGVGLGYACDSDDADKCARGVFACSADGGGLACPRDSETLTDIQESCLGAGAGVDDDCDGETDEENALGCVKHYADADDDGYGVPGDSRCLCGPETGVGALYRATKLGDCRDDNGNIHPGATEICGNAEEENCSGSETSIPEDLDAKGCTLYLLDLDADGYAADGAPSRCTCGPTDLFTASVAGDCEDGKGGINPGELETCATPIDDDCDDSKNDLDALGCTKFYADADHDDHGDVNGGFECRCKPEGLYSSYDALDCDDTRPEVHGGADKPPEVCDGLDNDCDDTTDEGFVLGAACSAPGGACWVGETACTDDTFGTHCVDALPADPGVPCGAASCGFGTLTPAPTCDGSGGCAPQPSIPCPGGFQCASDGLSCRTGCVGDVHCRAGWYCAGGTCSQSKALGAVCGEDAECASAQCTDGRCCGTASCGLCKECGASGACEAVPAGVHGVDCGKCHVCDGQGSCTPVPDGQDPKYDCNDQGVATCGFNGACDGGGGCAFYGPSDTCAENGCIPSGPFSVFKGSWRCVSAGSCQPLSVVDCDAHVCDPASGCAKPCGSDGNCLSGYYCQAGGGLCLQKQGIGQGCGADNQCTSGSCVNGLCV